MSLSTKTFRNESAIPADEMIQIGLMSSLVRGLESWLGTKGASLFKMPIFEGAEDDLPTYGIQINTSSHYAGEDLIQVCLSGAWRRAVVDWLDSRGLSLFPLPIEEDVPTFGIQMPQVPAEASASSLILDARQTLTSAVALVNSGETGGMASTVVSVLKTLCLARANSGQEREQLARELVCDMLEIFDGKGAAQTGSVPLKLLALDDPAMTQDLQDNDMPWWPTEDLAGDLADAWPVSAEPGTWVLQGSEIDQCRQMTKAEAIDVYLEQLEGYLLHQVRLDQPELSMLHAIVYWWLSILEGNHIVVPGLQVLDTSGNDIAYELRQEWIKATD